MTLQATETLQNGPFQAIFNSAGNFVGFLNPRAVGADLRISQFLGSFAWASRPDATLFAGASIRVSDVGLSPGIRMVSDGTRWRPDGIQVIARSGVATLVTGTATETALLTTTIPANFLGTNGQLLLQEAFFNMTSSGNNKTIRARLGGIAGTVLASTVYTTTQPAKMTVNVANRNSAAAQIFSSVANRGTDGVVVIGNGGTGTVDTTAAVDFVISGQLANTGETIQLDSYLLLVTP